MRFADIDAVTVDAFGTLVELLDPVPELVELLRRRGTDRDEAVVRKAFAAEAAYYRAHALTGSDPESLAELRRRCAEVFLIAADVEVEAATFAPEFVSALRFRALPGVEPALRALRARGLELAVVSNWDIGLHRHLHGLGLHPSFTAVVTSAEAGVEKPDPRIFAIALARLGVPAARAVHVGDDSADAEGAVTAGLRFERAPLDEAVRRWR